MSRVDQETQRLMDSIFIEKVLRARRTPMEEKILDGPRLFDLNCDLARSGIRAEHLDFSDEQVDHELGRQLAIARRISDAGIYRNIEDDDE